MTDELELVYFSSATENTKRFVEKLDLDINIHRIPLRAKDPFLNVDKDYILFCPSYGGGQENRAVPKQVIKFLNVKENRKHCVGIIVSGNTNFFEDYCIAGRILSSKLKVPVLYKFELLGTDEDVHKVNEGIKKIISNR